jgi:hypothetical protein
VTADAEPPEPLFGATNTWTPESPPVASVGAGGLRPMWAFNGGAGCPPSHLCAGASGCCPECPPAPRAGQDAAGHAGGGVLGPESAVRPSHLQAPHSLSQCRPPGPVVPPKYMSAGRGGGGGRAGGPQVGVGPVPFICYRRWLRSAHPPFPVPCSSPVTHAAPSVQGPRLLPHPLARGPARRASPLHLLPPRAQVSPSPSPCAVLVSDESLLRRGPAAVQGPRLLPRPQARGPARRARPLHLLPPLAQVSPPPFPCAVLVSCDSLRPRRRRPVQGLRPPALNGGRLGGRGLLAPPLASFFPTTHQCSWPPGSETETASRTMVGSFVSAKGQSCDVVWGSASLNCHGQTGGHQQAENGVPQSH